MPISKGKSRSEGDMGLTERTLRLLLDPLVETRKVVMMHALDLCHLLPLHDTVQTDRAILICQVADNLPLNPVPIGPQVLLPKQPLIGDAQSRIECVVEQGIMNGLPQQGVQRQFGMLLGLQQLHLLHQRQHESRSEKKEILPQEEGGLGDVDLGLLELAVLVLEEDDEGDVDGGEEEEWHGGEALLVEEGVEEEGDVYGSDQHRVHRDQLHRGALLSQAISITIIIPIKLQCDRWALPFKGQFQPSRMRISLQWEYTDLPTALVNFPFRNKRTLPYFLPWI